ncbi:hypothetical protein ACFSQ7_26020 [Paenibacillus rhizoplanae]
MIALDIDSVKNSDADKRHHFYGCADGVCRTRFSIGFVSCCLIFHHVSVDYSNADTPEKILIQTEIAAKKMF